jgi:hypothetical protein
MALGETLQLWTDLNPALAFPGHLTTRGRMTIPIPGFPYVAVERGRSPEPSPTILLTSARLDDSATVGAQRTKFMLVLLAGMLGLVRFSIYDGEARPMSSDKIAGWRRLDDEQQAAARTSDRAARWAPEGLSPRYCQIVHVSICSWLVAPTAPALSFYHGIAYGASVN